MLISLIRFHFGNMKKRKKATKELPQRRTKRKRKNILKDCMEICQKEEEDKAEKELNKKGKFRYTRLTIRALDCL